MTNKVTNELMHDLWEMGLLVRESESRMKAALKSVREEVGKGREFETAISNVNANYNMFEQ